jgi:hypothetical protein
MGCEYTKEADALAALPELETPCDYCKGEGGGTEASQWHDCPFCNGGYVPTAFGEKVLSLIRHNLRIEPGAVDWR